MDFHENMLKTVEAILHDGNSPPIERLHRILRLSAKHRGELIANTLLRGKGNVIRSGPFAGMVLPTRPAEGCYAPKLLGCYEAELHPCIEKIVARAPAHLVNVGCAEGYYAVGFARLMENTKIWAYDIDKNAQDVCQKTAEANGVADRMEIGGLFTHADFAQFPAGQTAVICDIEGAELELLDPEKAPALVGFDIQVELHNSFETSFNRNFISRFEGTHNIEYIRPGVRNIDSFEEIRNLEHLDQLLAFWEHRRGPNPWLFMTARNRGD